MSLFVVDVESDGPAPGLFSMVCFGAVKVSDDLDETFYGQTRPITEAYNPEALAISGFSRDEHERFDDPVDVMTAFHAWVLESNKSGRPVFFSDNPAFDWQWINYYFHRYVGENPFGFSARRIGDLYCGMQNNAYAGWKHLRKTTHDHHPVNDAKGNAEALLAMREMGLKL
ncbi:MAG: 3'-5' exoribonuclease [bacterium]